MADTPARPGQLHVLVGIGDHESGAQTLRQAADLARKLDAHLDVVHVTQLADLAALTLPAGLGGPPVSGDDLRQGVELEAAHDWAWITAELGGTEGSWTLHRAEGDPAHILTDLAEAVDAYCVVVGSRGEGFGAFLGRLLRPSVSRALIRDLHRPVMVVASSGAE